MDPLLYEAQIRAIRRNARTYERQRWGTDVTTPAQRKVLFSAMKRNRGLVLGYLFGIDPALPTRSDEPGPGHRLTKGQASAVIDAIVGGWFTPEFQDYMMRMAALAVIRAKAAARCAAQAAA